MNDSFEDDLLDPVVSNPPSEIFLNVGNIEEDCDFDDLDEISWSVGQIYEADVQYVLASRLRRLEDLRRWRPMSEPPKAEGFYCVRPSTCQWTECFTWEDGYWMCRGQRCVADLLSDYVWTYIPGQEPADV